MQHRPLTIKVPGKLMIAGEFAVLEPYQKLVVMAVNRFVYAALQQSNENKITLADFKLNNLTWEYMHNKVSIHSDDTRVHFVEDAMTIALNYLQENNVKLNRAHFSLSIKSELDDHSGVKYGLGSSAAVVTAVTSAILKEYLPKDPSAMLIFRLAAISHVKTQGNGSGADVAASSHGGILQYSSFQANWLKKAYEKANSLTELLEEDWPYFSVKPIHLPENVHICIGWTGTPASTSKLVDHVLQLKKDEPSAFQQFLNDSETAVAAFFQGMQEKNIPLLLEGVKKNRQSLAAVGRASNTEIETPLLRTLCDLAEQYGGAGKPSGAGGGDCGIAFMPSREKAEALMDAWEKAGIKPLDIQVNEAGAISI